MATERLKSRLLCGLAALTMAWGWGAQGTPTMAQSFTVPSGTTETTPQSLGNDETGIVQSGGTLSTIAPFTPAISGTNNNSITNDGTLRANAQANDGIFLDSGNTIANTGDILILGTGSVGIDVFDNNVINQIGTLSVSNSAAGRVFWGTTAIH